MHEGSSFWCRLLRMKTTELCCWLVQYSWDREGHMKTTVTLEEGFCLPHLKLQIRNTQCELGSRVLIQTLSVAPGAILKKGLMNGNC